MISGAAKLAGVIGWPVAHSRSPRLHGHWLQRYGIDGAYVPLAVSPEDFPEAIRALPRLGFRGVNLTLPHKEAGAALCDTLEEDARSLRAVNTLIFNEGKIHGSNTDVYGFAENIRPHLNARRRAVLLGTGGAARGVVLALHRLGFESISVVGRDPAKTRALCELSLSAADAVDWKDSATALTDADLLVNATSLGMQGQPALEINLDALPPSALVTDIVYTPRETQLLAAAKARGNPVIEGLGMLLHQAAPGFEAWFGVRPEVDAALERAVTAA